MARDFTGTGVDFKVYGSNAEILAAMQKHDINLWLLDGVPAYSLLKSPAGRDFTIAGNYPYIDPSLVGHKIAVNRDNSSLLIFIDEALVHLQGTGRMQDITQKYFPSVSY